MSVIAEKQCGIFILLQVYIQIFSVQFIKTTLSFPTYDLRTFVKGSVGCKCKDLLQGALFYFTTLWIYFVG